MSTTHDDLPFDLQTEIIKRIPDVKSLIRFRSVSKPWKSLIDSSKFISAYKSTNHRLLLMYHKPANFDCGFASVADDDSFPQHNFHHLTPPNTAGILVGISQGLFCFYHSRDVQKRGKVQVNSVIVVWNPSIRKSVTYDSPDHSYDTFKVFGFGVCRRTCDPKLVCLKYYPNIFVSAEIFTLSSGDWRTRSINLPNIISNTGFCYAWDDWDHKAVIDGILYLHAITKKDYGKDSYNRIITFDLTSEEFRQVCLPDKLAPRLNDDLSISKLNESLVVLEYYRAHESQVCDVWRMEGGASKLFVKLFIINTPFICIIKGFRMNGQAIIEAKERKKEGILKVYDPCTRHVNDHIFGIRHRVLQMGCYIETLLLFNQSDFIIH